MHLSNQIYLKFITRNVNKHISCDKVIAAFVYDYATKDKHYFNFCHPDVDVNDTLKSFIKYIKSEDRDVYVNNKKRYKYILKNCNLIDVNLFGFLRDNEIIEEQDSETYLSIKIRVGDINDMNVIYPYVNHQKDFDQEVLQIETLNEEKKDSYCFKFFNNVISDTLYEVEKNGIKIDESIFKEHFKAKTNDGYVYTQYNIYNPTGRPSNKFDSVNYVALNKEDGCRKSFVSRYDGGHLMMIDFTGFHPYIVSNLIDYKVPDNETIYEHLAKQYYNVDVVDAETMGKSKKLTMVNLYGQIKDQYLSIPYFAKTDQLKNKYWEMFEKKGYVTTPIYKRKITINHIKDPNKNKLFAYIIQAAETEYGLNSLGNVIKYLSDKPMLPILYVYDSILFDVSKDVTQQTLNDVIDIVKNKKFKVKVYTGNNYHDLKLQQS